MGASQRRDGGLTAEVLLLRRRDEADARSALQAAQDALQQTQERAALAKRRLMERQARAAREQASFEALVGDVPAGALQQQAQRLRHAQQDVEQIERACVAAELAVVQGRQAVDECRQTFLTRRAQREAAELFAEQERAAQRRLRANRTRVIEEEARERFASAKRRGQP